MRKFNESKEEKKESKEAEDLASVLSLAMERPEMRTVAVYGDINEERCAEAVYGLLTLDMTSRTLITENKVTEDEKVV